MMIASLGPCLPRDLLEATGRYAGALPWRLAGATPQADRWLESKFPLWSRSVVEDWAAGRFDDLEAVVFSRGDDAVQRLYYYICELQRRGLLNGPHATMFDVAQIPRPTSEAHTISAVRRLASEFGLDDAALETGIVDTNARRRVVAPIPTEAPACLLGGTPPPHGLLHQAIVAAGFAPVGGTLAEAWSALGQMVDEGSQDPAAAIGRQVHAQRNDRRGFVDVAGATVELAREVAARAAVLWYGEEDEVRVWELPRMRDALTAAGVPLLVMTRRDEAAQDGAPEEVRTFLQGLGS